MDIRTFEAFSMKDAVKSVKRELGPDAVILSTKEKLSPEGTGKVYEVTAARANQSRPIGASRTGELRQGQANLELDSRLEHLGLGLTALREEVSTQDQVLSLETGLREIKLLLLESLRTSQGSSLKDLPEHLVNIHRQLRIMGVDEIHVTELMKALRGLEPPSKDTVRDGHAEEYYRGHAIRWMIKKIKIAPRLPLIDGTTAVQGIVGTTGSGKTTLVAKLAAHYHLKERAKVAVASFDNHRLAASDQMRIFCKIIGVPFTAMSSPSELMTVLGQHRDKDLVLIDTAGRSPKHDSMSGELGELKTAGIPIDFHLCLSITEKESQLDQAIRSFSPLGLQSLIFTKLDESWSFGEIFNVIRKWGLPLSFFSIGQKVPSDIERATRERVIERIFGL